MIKNLKAVVSKVENGREEEVEWFDLIKDGKYVGFNRLHELVGRDYYNLNDDLMDGDLTNYLKYEFGELTMRITFIEEV